MKRFYGGLPLALILLGCNQVVDWPATNLDDGPDAGDISWVDDSQNNTDDALIDAGPTDAGDAGQ